MHSRLRERAPLAGGAYLAELRGGLDALDLSRIAAAADAIETSARQDRQVFVVGNGGSASTAGHFVTDLLHSWTPRCPMPGLRASCLNDSVSTLTALANDVSYDRVFQIPLRALARPGDLLVAISGSGNSPNVVGAARWASRHGVGLVALTGFEGGALATLADIHLHVPSRHYGPVEDLHLSICHLICENLRARWSAEG